MASIFDQYNQSQQYKLDPQEAIGMLGKGGSEGPQWQNYNTGSQGISAKGTKDTMDGLGKLFGSGGGDSSGQQMSLSPDVAPLQQQGPALGQESPQQAMGMVAPQASPAVQWKDYGAGGGGGGGGGGMDMSSMASIAMAFV